MAAGASSSSARPTTRPAPTGPRRTCPGLWTMADTWDKPHYTNVQMPFAGLPPEIPDGQPDRRLRARVRGPRRLARARPPRRPPRRRRRERPDRRARRRGGRRRQGLAPRLRIRPDGPRRRRAPTPSASRVVKWSDATYVEDQDQWWHGGISRPVFLYATRDVHLADIRADAGPGRRRPRDRHARPDRHGRLPGPRAAARLDGRGDARWGAGRRTTAPAAMVDRTTLTGWTREIQDVMYTHAAGLLPPEDEGLWQRGPRRDGAAARRPRDLARRGPGRPAAGRPSSRTSTRSTSRSGPRTATSPRR